jgi:hypothetical protein
MGSSKMCTLTQLILLISIRNGAELMARQKQDYRKDSTGAEQANPKHLERCLLIPASHRE